MVGGTGKQRKGNINNTLSGPFIESMSHLVPVGKSSAVLNLINVPIIIKQVIDFFILGVKIHFPFQARLDCVAAAPQHQQHQAE